MATVHCPRCDRAFMGTTREAALQKMQIHLEKHEDYDPELHGTSKDVI